MTEESVEGDSGVKRGPNREAVIKEPTAGGSRLRNADKLTADKRTNKTVKSEIEEVDQTESKTLGRKNAKVNPSIHQAIPSCLQKLR